MKIKWLTTLSMLGFYAGANGSALNLDVQSVTVSGLSSGGYMANQFHLAHSNWVQGAAIIAAGPYYCAQGSIGTALTQCVDKSDSALPLTTLNQKIKEYQSQQLIAPIDNLSKSRVWLFHGTLDTRINSAVTDALHLQYSQWLDDYSLRYVNDKPMAHLMPTIDAGVPCDKSQSPFIGHCDFDAAGEFLSFLYQDLSPPSDKPTGVIKTIDQRELGSEAADSLAQNGYMYVPQTCASGQQCQVHISFHGCNQNAQAIDQQFVQNNGLNPWADTNNLVILYPQTKTSMMMPLNPQGCWDWWGYTGDEYATVNGPQIKAVKHIVMSLAQQHSTQEQ